VIIVNKKIFYNRNEKDSDKEFDLLYFEDNKDIFEMKIKRLIEKGKINSSNKVGNTILNYLIMRNEEEKALELLERMEIEGINKVNLHTLYLQNNQISKIKGLEFVVDLYYLTLQNNQISKIEGLDSLVNLNYLNLQNNKISKIEGLDSLVNLNYLNLQNNKISKIEGLDSLVNLQKLHLNNNQISKNESLESLGYLQYLDLEEIQ